MYGKAIVLGCTQSGLAVVRSLNRKGINVLVLTINEDEPGLRSRYVKEWYKIPHPDEEQAFLENLLRHKETWQGALILESNDYYATAISRNREMLSEYFRIVTAGYDQLQVFMEKDNTYRHADAVGVPHPGIWYPQSMKDLDECMAEIKFPVMIKPVISYEFVAHFGRKLFIVETETELHKIFQQTVNADMKVVISEVIPGTDYKTLERVQVYINSKGEVAALFSNTKLRQTPPMYGVMRVGKSTPPNAEVTELAMRFLKPLDYCGFASVEFKRDPRDNQLKLIEINVRMPRSLPLPIAAGIDFPYLIYEDLVNDNQIKVEDYNQDIYLIELIEDFVNFVRKDKNRDIKLYLQPYFAKNKSFSYLEWSDPMPFIHEVRRRSAKFMKDKVDS